MRQVSAPLRWISAFLSGAAGPVRRSVALGPTEPPRVSITTDASPWGLGAVLHRDGMAISWLAVQWTDEDHAKVFRSAGKLSISALEALCVLVAARTWARAGHTRFSVRSDSAVGLAALCRLNSSSSLVLRIVLEAWLDLASEKHSVSVGIHVPGVANLEADALSRLWAPDPKQVPESLAGVDRATPVDFRSREFWSVSRRAAPASAAAAR